MKNFDNKKIFFSLSQGPLTGRISRIVPFLTFKSEEQAVIAHKFILWLAIELQPPICHNKQRLIGHVDLKVGLHPADGDAHVCKLLAEAYNPKTGARLLDQKIWQSVKCPWPRLSSKAMRMMRTKSTTAYELNIVSIIALWAIKSSAQLLSVPFTAKGNDPGSNLILAFSADSPRARWDEWINRFYVQVLSSVP